MPTLHINDNNLLLQALQEEGGEIIQRSRGYAWFQGEDVTFDLTNDVEPVRQCRRVPQQINSRYWQQCAQTAIGENAAGMRHAADIIWKHLGEFKKLNSLEKLALVVPANYRDAHLQLLLGVSKANDLDITSLISKPVWASLNSGIKESQIVHLDVQLHQTVVSRIEKTSAEITLKGAEVNAELSLQSIQEALLQSLQASFIRDGRFDPLHDAHTEQQLFDQLPELVNQALKNEKSSVGVEHQGKLYNSVVEPSEVKNALAPLLSLIDQLGSQPLLVDMNAEYDLSALLLPNVNWVSGVVALPNKLAAGMSSDGNVIYQTSLELSEELGQIETKPGTQSTTQANTQTTTKSKAASSQPSAGKQINGSRLNDSRLNDLNSINQTAAVTHVMQHGVAVPLAHAFVHFKGLELILQSKKAEGNIASLLAKGDLQVINDLGRLSLKPNDRIISSVAEGVLMALTVH